MNKSAVRWLVVAVGLLCPHYVVRAQSMPDIGFHSVGRGWPVEPALPSSGRDPAALYDFDPGRAVGPLRVLVNDPNGRDSRSVEVIAARDGKAPRGVSPLPVDLFT